MIERPVVEATRQGPPPEKVLPAAPTTSQYDAANPFAGISAHDKAIMDSLNAQADARAREQQEARERAQRADEEDAARETQRRFEIAKSRVQELDARILGQHLAILGDKAPDQLTCLSDGEEAMDDIGELLGLAREFGRAISKLTPEDMESTREALVGFSKRCTGPFTSDCSVKVGRIVSLQVKVRNLTKKTADGVRVAAVLTDNFGDEVEPIGGGAHAFIWQGKLAPGKTITINAGLLGYQSARKVSNCRVFEAHFTDGTFW
jgi:hypothetical protein